MRDIELACKSNPVISYLNVRIVTSKSFILISLIWLAGSTAQFLPSLCNFLPWSRLEKLKENLYCIIIYWTYLYYCVLLCVCIMFCIYFQSIIPRQSVIKKRWPTLPNSVIHITTLVTLVARWLFFFIIQTKPVKLCVM